MDISKLVRKNKEFVEEPKANIIHKEKKQIRKSYYTPVTPNKTNYDKLKEVLSDGIPRSHNYLMIKTRNKSAGNLHHNLTLLVHDGILEVTTCGHCDSNIKLYKLK